MQGVGFKAGGVLAFQSAPGREAGRCHSAARNDTESCSFNPRPAVRPGDAAVQVRAVQVRAVSIRARP